MFVCTKYLNNSNNRYLASGSLFAVLSHGVVNVLGSCAEIPISSRQLKNTTPPALLANG